MQGARVPGAARLCRSSSAHRSFLTYVAVVTEVNVDDAGRVTIPNMHIAGDAGQTCNQDRVLAQF